MEVVKGIFKVIGFLLKALFAVIGYFVRVIQEQGPKLIRLIQTRPAVGYTVLAVILFLVISIVVSFCTIIPTFAV